MSRITLEDGKYVVISKDGHLTALRNGEQWRSMTGDKLIGAMFDEIERLHKEIERLRGIIEAVNSWAVCGCIASAEDMAQNLPHIVEITSLPA